MYAKWIVAIVFISVCACKNSSHADDPQKSAKLPLQIDMAGKGDDREEYWYKHFTETANKLGLDSLIAGYDSLQVRIWLGHSLAIRKHVVTISCTNNKWKAKVITYSWLDPESRERYIERPAITRRTVSPELGWADLIYDLKEIINLPHSETSAACNKCGSADGIDYFFEVATKDKYRLFYYCNPEYTCDCDPAMKVIMFAATLEREFNFHYIR